MFLDRAKALLGAVAFVSLLVPDSACRKPEGAVPIGVALPLSGTMAESGQNAREGLTLASEELARRPEMKKFHLIYQDTKEAPQDTVDAVRRLIDLHGVRFIIGGLTSSGVLAAAPYAQSRGVLFFSPAASAPGIPEIGDLIFRNWPADDMIAKEFGQAAYSRLGVRKVAILHISNDSGKVNAESFATSFKQAGGSVLLMRAFPQGATDFRTLITQVSSLEDMDKVLVVAYPDEYRAFFQQMPTSHLRGSAVLATDTLFSPALLSELGPIAEGTVCAVAGKPGEDYEARKRFIQSYRARFRGRDGKPKDPGLVSDTAYDALWLLVSGISRTDGSPKAVAQWLLGQERPYPGAAGLTFFTSTGDVKGELALYQVQKGRFVALVR